MSNFSPSENEPEKKSYSVGKTQPNGSDKTVAFLAALQETQNVLNVLMQAVLYRDSYEENAHQTNKSLESDDEYKENKACYPRLDEAIISGIDIVNTSTYLGPTLSLETISVEGSKVKSNVVPLPWVKINNLTVKHKQEIMQPQSTDSDIDDSGPIDDKLSSGQSSVVNRLKPKIDSESSSPICNKNYPEAFLSGTRTEVLQKPNILKHEENDIFHDMRPEADNSENCNSASRNVSKEYSLSWEPLSDDEKDLSKPPETTNTKQKDIAAEIKRLVGFSQKIINMYKENKTLNEVEDHSTSVVDKPCEKPSPNVLSATSLNVPKLKERGLRGESENKKKETVLHLPPDSIPISLSRCEEMVGDEPANNNSHILCECEQPGVSGGAVPMVTSFTVSQTDNKKLDEIEIQKAVKPVNNIPKAKQSFIPKLTSSSRNSENISSLTRTEKQRCLVSSSNSEENYEHKEEQLLVAHASSKMLTLQQKLKAKTSLIRQKISTGLDKPEDEKNKRSQQTEKLQLRFDEESFERRNRQKKLRHEFSKNINRMVKDVSNLSDISDLNAQTEAVDNLYRYIKNLKRLSDELNTDSGKNFSPVESQDANESQIPSFGSEQKVKAKDNKIYIKLLSSKLAAKKKKCCNTEVQTESTKEKESESAMTKKKSNGESLIKVDSMDGMFIPSSEEPPTMNEDEDDDGLDITITFPEFEQHIAHEAASHLSVCFSDISAEALVRLKRCPKEFTLRMDFVHGKMFFQSGNSPANNFSIGPDLKITECLVDNKMSDLISIKPSTECMYTSQLIPVEGTKRNISIKTLKSTDSELFNVVSLPIINGKTLGNIKSCITFKNERYMSAGCLLTDKRSFKSMPQIPSMTNILEELVMESANTSTAAMMNSDKKPRNRTPQRKKTNISLEKLSEA